MSASFDSKELKNIVEVLRKVFPVQRAYLFGSRADGSARAESDYDIVLVISTSPLSPLQRAQAAHEALWDAQIHLPTDLFIYTIEEFEKRKSLFNSIAEIAFSTGVEVTLDPS